MSRLLQFASLVALARLAPASDRPGLTPVGPGCCHGIAEEDEYYHEAGLTLDECVHLCDRDWPRCRAVEHNPWALGVCHLFQAVPSGLNCPLSEKVCWSLPPEHGGPQPYPHAEGSRERSMSQMWHAQELWDALDCRGKGNFDEIRKYGMAAATIGIVDHLGMWKAARRGGFIGHTEPGDTPQFFSSDKNEDFLGRIVAGIGRFQNLLRGDTEFDEVKQGALSDAEPCTYGFLFLLWLCLKRFRELEQEKDAREVAWALRLVFWTHIGGPESTLDLLQSTSWPVSSWDLVVATLDAGGKVPVMTYGEHVQRYPTPPPFLPGPLEDLPSGPGGARRPPRTAGGQPWPCGASQTARVATIGIMRQMQMHQLSALQAAWAAVCGADVGAPAIEVLFVYTDAGPMAEYDLGSVADRQTDWERETQQWQGMRVRFLPGGMRQVSDLRSLEDVEADFKAKMRGEAALQDAHLLVCGEPVYVCTAASHTLEEANDARPLLAHLGMALLHQPKTDSEVLNSREKVARFLLQFLTMLARPTVTASVANRITAEQVFWQVGVRLPLAHFAGVHLQPRSDREDEAKALLFRTKFPFLAHVFLKALKLFNRLQSSGVDLVDMNNYASLSWAEIAHFRAVVLLPHNVHLIRTADLYALEMMLFVPAEPFIFQFIFPGSNLYGGHGGDRLIRLGLDGSAQRKLHRALRLHEAGYTLAVARTAAEPGELLPRAAHRYCPYRFPSLGTCHRQRSQGYTMVDACPWGFYDLDSETQTPLSCEETVESTLALRPLAGSLCAEEAVRGGSAAAAAAGVAGATADAAEEGPPDYGPAVDPFDYLYGDYNPWCNLESYRYWYAHTEYSLLRGVQKFGSAAELLEGLAAVLLGPDAPERRRVVLEEMRAHQRGRVRETVHWWAHALLVTTRAGGRAGAGGRNAGSRRA